MLGVESLGNRTRSRKLWLALSPSLSALACSLLKRLGTVREPHSAAIAGTSSPGPNRGKTGKLGDGWLASHPTALPSAR
ncbi:hypothetical protein LZ32DRAFT_599211 [Colletotrichum eremochloae]|nr:hypothetical protein LZ32DRAFT_599211 [Colletotrichum eremochloae]